MIPIREAVCDLTYFPSDHLRWYFYLIFMDRKLSLYGLVTVFKEIAEEWFES